MDDIIEIIGKRYRIAANAFTPIVYSGEFTFMKENGRRRAKDINDGLAEIMDGIASSGIPPLLPMLQFFWAFCKTADKSAPGFKAWLEGLPEQAFDMSADESWAQPVLEMIQAAYFRSATQVASEGAEDAAAGAAAGA